MQEETTPSADVLGTPEGIQDPYPAYRALRGISPVRYLRVLAGPRTGLSEPVYAYALLRHADVLAAVRDPSTFSSNSVEQMKVVPRVALLHDDPPRHAHLRRLVNKAFTAQRIAALTTFVEGMARELTDSMTNDAEVDLMSVYAQPLPIRVIATMLGVPQEDYPSFRSWSTAVVAYASMPAEERGQKTQALMGYFAQTIAARRREPKNDLITAFTQAEVEGVTLSDAEIVKLAVVLLLAGHETTANLLGNLLGILADRPALYEEARGNPALVEPIVEETIRFESPVQRFQRVAAKDVEIAGKRIEAGALLDMFFGAANRDPAVFEDPDSFRLDRPNKDHLGFGHGIHFCLGAPLARLEAKTTLSVFFERFKRIERGAEPAARQRMAQLSFGYETLPLVMRA